MPYGRVVAGRALDITLPTIDVPTGVRRSEIYNQRIQETVVKSYQKRLIGRMNPGGLEITHLSVCFGRHITGNIKAILWETYGISTDAEILKVVLLGEYAESRPEGTKERDAAFEATVRKKLANIGAPNALVYPTVLGDNPLQLGGGSVDQSRGKSQYQTVGNVVAQLEDFRKCMRGILKDYETDSGMNFWIPFVLPPFMDTDHLDANHLLSHPTYKFKLSDKEKDGNGHAALVFSPVVKTGYKITLDKNKHYQT